MSKRATSKGTGAQLQVISNNLSIAHAAKEGTYTFSCGHTVPIYEAYTVHALNQLIGYAKFLNKNYGNVYYRGECRLHDSLKPSLYRKGKNVETATARLTALLKKIYSDSYMSNELKINRNKIDVEKNKIEAMLQHYGIPTRFIDVVDNHWIALWMGLNYIEHIKQVHTYYHYVERIVSVLDLTSDSKEKDFYQYILLITIPFSSKKLSSGIEESSNFMQIDLRQALPSLFQRPHAQHGLVIRKKRHEEDMPIGMDAYDLASSVIGVVKIRIDRAKEWLGRGTLLTQNNLFPSPAYDYGYDLFLDRSDLFEECKPFEITRYI